MVGCRAVFTSWYALADAGACAGIVMQILNRETTNMKSHKELTPKEFAKACDEIVKRIEKIETEKDSVVVDGVINPEQYLKAPLKVMWLLKEANAKGAETWYYQDAFTEQSWLDKHANRRSSLRRPFYVSYGILTHDEKLSWATIPHILQPIGEKFTPRQAVQQIAFVNIKKIPGGSNSSDMEIEQAYQDDRDLLKSQFDLYDPDVVILGGTMKYIDKSDFPGLSQAKEQHSEFGNYYYDTESKLYVNTWHPGVRGKGFTDEGYVMDIVNIVRHWRKKHDLSRPYLSPSSHGKSRSGFVGDLP
jgi:hypothetical protein